MSDRAMGLTAIERIISRRVGRTVRAGEVLVTPVDAAMASDATAPYAIEAFEAMGGGPLWDPDRVTLVIDHASPAPNLRVGNLHRMMREFAEAKGCRLYDVGAGICHQVMIEGGHARAGEIVLGADSHSCTYGAVGAFAAGVGSTDLAAVLRTGKTWLKVPPTIRVELDGRLPAWTSAKDAILFLVGRLGLSRASYQALEYTGTVVRDLSVAGRMTVASMSAEMGAKAGIVDPQGLDLPDLADGSEPVWADDDATYAETHRFDLSTLSPQVSVPHSPADVVPVEEVQGTRVTMAFIGTCTNGRLEDLEAAARLLRGRTIAPHVRLLVTPASREVFNQALREGVVETLSQAGATFITPGCGPCVGTHLGVPGDDEAVISSANRNFPGRMGNPNARVFLGSPAVVAASALRGAIVHPGEVADLPVV